MIGAASTPSGYIQAMPARLVDPATVAASFRAQLRDEVAALGRPLTLLGLLAEGDAPSATYAEYTRKGCDDVGIRFELHKVLHDDAERAVRQASADPEVHGILVYYPIGGSERDRWLRELVDPRKDIEGLHSFWARCLYENRRYVDSAHRLQAVLPSTPLAILKLLDEAGASNAEAARPLDGVTACVFNRSEVVGYPLAAMMANDGAEVYSFDVDGPKLFVPGEGDDAHRTRATFITRKDALARSSVVITGVPSRSFPLIGKDELKPGAICLNFSTLRNFAPDVVDQASVFVPRVGPMTVTMALRNTVRLYKHGALGG
ncbi:MAG: Methylenetetrahydrofolate dehydrogenase [Pseudomonadota bacterium]|jgi:methylenetetrahydrofolate dehydrogenase (NADP+)/methenyltetrahydrofolate cyclohydrolase